LRAFAHSFQCLPSIDFTAAEPPAQRLTISLTSRSFLERKAVPRGAGRQPRVSPRRTGTIGSSSARAWATSSRTRAYMRIIGAAEGAIASKAKRVAGIIALMLVGLCVIVFGWVFVVEHTLPTQVGLHSFGKVDVNGWDQGFVLAEGTWRPERKPERILFLTLNKPLNISKIRCVRQSGFCEVATAMLGRSASYGDYLDLELNQIEIKKWTSTTLEFSVK
jgi:hypothetical protein